MLKLQLLKNASAGLSFVEVLIWFLDELDASLRSLFILAREHNNYVYLNIILANSLITMVIFYVKGKLLHREEITN